MSLSWSINKKLFTNNEQLEMKKFKAIIYNTKNI